MGGEAFRSPGDRTEQFILPGLLVQDFAASLTKESPACHWFPSDDSGVFWEKPISSLVEKANLFSLVKSQLFIQSQVFSRKWLEIDDPKGKSASAAPCHHGWSTGEAAAALPCSPSRICELQAGTSTSSRIHGIGAGVMNAPCPAAITWVLLRVVSAARGDRVWAGWGALIIYQIRIQPSLLTA